MYVPLYYVINRTIALTHQRFYAQKQLDYNADLKGCQYKNHCITQSIVKKVWLFCPKES